MKILSLFGGIASPEKALLNLGIDFKQLDYVEIDPKAVRTFNFVYSKLNEKKPQSVVGWTFKPDLLVHGSPCQDFSRAGKRLGGLDEDKTRSSLLFETLKIVEGMGEWKPKVILWENVKGVLDKDMRHAFESYVEFLDELGYNTVYQILDARDFGVPQARERLYAVSTLDKPFDFSLLNKKKMKPLSSYLEPGLPHQRYLVDQPSMLRRLDIPENKGTGGFKRGVRIVDDFVWTITTKQVRSPNAGVIPIGEGQYRYLTERECWRLMGFDDKDYDQAERAHPRRKEYMNTTLYAQAGNSIVVQTLEAIFEAMFNQGFLKEEKE